jgi:hypothetical protein
MDLINSERITTTIIQTTITESFSEQLVSEPYRGAVECVFAASVGLLVGGRWLHARRQRRRKQQPAGLALAAAPRTALDDVDEVFADMADDD